jgi:hypothetical protein
MNNKNPFDQKSLYQFTNEVGNLRLIRNHVLATEMNFSGRTLSSGVIMLGDNGKTDGIRPRWCRVYAVGPEQTDVKVGQWILVEHGRWSRGIKIKIGDSEEAIYQRIDPEAIMLVQDQRPEHDEVISTAVHAEAKTR